MEGINEQTMSSNNEGGKVVQIEAAGGTSGREEVEKKEEEEGKEESLVGMVDNDPFLEGMLSSVSALSARDSALAGEATAGMLAPYQPYQPAPPPPPPHKATIHLVRHAEGPHNLGSIPEPQRIAMLDPSLTTYGKAQSVLLSTRFQGMEKITYILSSPLSRCVLTTLLGFKPAIDQGANIVLLPDLRECGRGPCNTGSKIPVLLEEMYKEVADVRNDCIKTDCCDEGWELQMESWSDVDARKERAARVREMLFDLGKMSVEEEGGDVEIVVVTHSRFIMALEEITDLNKSYYNAEYKSYQVVEEEGAAPGAKKFKLVETEESKRYVHTYPPY